MNKKYYLVLFILTIFSICKILSSEEKVILSKTIEKTSLPSLCRLFLTAGNVEVLCETNIPSARSDYDKVYAKRFARESAIYNGRNYLAKVFNIVENFVKEKEGFSSLSIPAKAGIYDSGIQLSPVASAVTANVIEEYEFNKKYVIKLEFPIFWKNTYTTSIISELNKQLE